jgi:chemotaxis response regulator CheB
MNIAIVNDSMLAVEAIRQAVASNPRHRVLWTARDGREAVARCALEQPDLVLMDMLMPDVDGVEATRQIMRAHPCPILVVTASVRGNSSAIFQAMGAGALDVVATPPLNDPAGRAALLQKIEQIECLTHDAPPAAARASRQAGGKAASAVLVGSSAGGPAALATLLGALPADFPAGIVIVQHVDERFAEELAQWLHSRSTLPVRAAREGDTPAPGEALLAARAEHLIFRKGGTLGYTPHPESAHYRPSVDRLFESALTSWTKPLIGVLLTGMGRDGANGLKLLREAGHFTIAQDEATSALYGMPKAAAESGAACEILPLDLIAPRLVEKVASFR